jgi:hypothetical protein
MHHARFSSPLFIICLRSLGLLCCIFASAAAQEFSPPVSKESLKLHVARNGAEVAVSWEAPAEQVRIVEIYRNTREDVKGRNRCAALRPLPAMAVDTVPDAKTTYWYWLKIILKDGNIMNVGPVATPSADVWVP